jgi:hypothetical protein
VKGERSGYGQLSDEKGFSLYRGTFLNDKYEMGKGVIDTPEGIYVGHFKGGQIHGQGKMKFNDGREYKGRWK